MRGFTRREVLGGLSGAAAAAWLAPGCAQRAASRPNLLLLLADDQRADSLRCTGNQIVETPQLDALARRGTIFRKAFVTTSICPASRASIFTGQTARHHGVFNFDAALSNAQLDHSYPALLRQAGYETAFLGKWGVDANRRPPFAEAVRLFDYWAGAPWQDNYWHQASCRYVTASGRVQAGYNECDCPADSYGVAGARARTGKFNQREPLHLITQILPRRFEDFLDTRDAARPFCASVSFKAPHAPLEDWDSRFASLYHGVEIPLPESFSLTPDPALPAALRDSYSGFNPLLAGDVEIVRGKHRHVYRHISGLDLSVGLMLQALAERGLDRDTVVLFSSDNGHLMGEHGLWGKSLMYEESLRVPLLIYDPREGGAWRQRESDAMVLNIDLAPTLCELGGVAPAADADGLSLVPLLRGERDSLRDVWLFEHQFRTQQAALPRNRGIRTARWKYLRLLDPVPAVEMLFDLEADPFERRDLAQDPGSRDMLLALRARYQELTTPPRNRETR